MIKRKPEKEMTPQNAERCPLAHPNHGEQVVAVEEATQSLAVNVWSSISIMQVPLACLKTRRDNVHMGMVNKQATSWTVPSALKTGVAASPFVISQSNALKVRAKLKMFLKMIRHVKPSMAKSPDTPCQPSCACPV